MLSTPESVSTIHQAHGTGDESSSQPWPRAILRNPASAQPAKMRKDSQHPPVVLWLGPQPARAVTLGGTGRPGQV